MMRGSTIDWEGNHDTYSKRSQRAPASRNETNHQSRRGNLKSCNLSQHFNCSTKSAGDVEHTDNNTVLTMATSMSEVLSEILTAPSKQFSRNEVQQQGMTITVARISPQAYSSRRTLSDHLQAHESWKTNTSDDQTVSSNASGWTGVLSELLAKSVCYPLSENQIKGENIIMRRSCIPSPLEVRKSMRKKSTKGRRKERHNRRLEFDQAFLGNELVISFESDDHNSRLPPPGDCTIVTESFLTNGVEAGMSCKAGETINKHNDKDSMGNSKKTEGQIALSII